MNNVLHLIDIKKDKWVLPSSDHLAPYTFNFGFLPNEWFKETIKNITKENITIGRLKLSTLHRYNYSLETFFLYLEVYDIEIENFEDISYELIEGFIHYLLANVNKPSTRTVAVSSLKHYIRHGQLFK